MKPPEPKTGPVPKGYVDIHVNLSRQDRDWAKRQPEGVSALVRRLVHEERRRRGNGGTRHAASEKETKRGGPPF